MRDIWKFSNCYTSFLRPKAWRMMHARCSWKKLVFPPSPCYKCDFDDLLGVDETAGFHHKTAKKINLQNAFLSEFSER